MTAQARPPAPRRRLGVGAVVVLVIVAFAVTVAIGLLRGSPQSADVLVPAASTEPEVRLEGATVYVHVAGAVYEPGLYSLESGARAFDAIAAAGGFADDAETSAVNLARAVSDGEQIVVPRMGEAPPAAQAGAPPSSGGGQAGGDIVDLNTADAAGLDSLPRIGPALAERIIAWRDENGRFTSVDDLLAVPGIGEKLLAGLRDRVRV